MSGIVQGAARGARFGMFLIVLGLVGSGLYAASRAANAAASAAGGATYNFKDPKGVNNVQFILDSELEPIMGVASGVSGTVQFDPAAPDKTTGSIVIDAKSVGMANEKMREVLHSADWLDVQKYPEIQFVLKKVSGVKAKDGVVELQATGDFTCRGVTREITAPVKLTHLPGKGKERGSGEGDLLALRTQFSIRRADFGLSKASPLVADEIQIRAAIVGLAPKK